MTAPDTAGHQRAVILRWLLTFGALTAVTASMYLVRASLDKAHVALVYLLVVLAASAVGGRTLGLVVSALAFVCFDFFFLVPYLTLTIENPLDWLVLLAFLITSVVAAQLLSQAKRTAEEATQRAIEVDRLAALGAETLNAADADDALRAIAGVIRHSIDAEECDIFLSAIDGQIVRVAAARLASSAPPRQETARGSLAEWILERGTSAVELSDGTVRLAHELRAGRLAPPRALQSSSDTVDAVQAVTRFSHTPVVRALALPLRVRDRTVGVLRVAKTNELLLSPEQGRLLVALAYYAALGAERARLVATAERAEAERRLESLRSALLTAVSHDLRTPLTTIKGVASELRQTFGHADAGVIEAEVDRMDALVSDILDLSRIHAGAVQPAIARNTVDDLLGAALRAAAGVLADRSVEIDAPSDALLAAHFDFTQTLRIVVNLLDNAVKYSPAGSPITVRAYQRDARLMIDVMDRGPGVPTRERGRIFDPFYRPPGVPPDIRGHGLGLSIARGLAEAQGGSVRFAERPGGGSVFTLELAAAETLPVYA